MLSGVTLCGIQSVTENTDAKNDKGGWVAYPPLSAFSSVIPGWHTTIAGRALPVVTGSSITTAYVMSNALTVRFTLQ